MWFNNISAIDKPQQIENNDKYNNKSQTTPTPFPPGIAGNKRFPELVHSVKSVYYGYRKTMPATAQILPYTTKQ
jgi:hypothetical protein